MSLGSTASVDGGEEWVTWVANGALPGQPVRSEPFPLIGCCPERPGAATVLSLGPANQIDCRGDGVHEERSLINNPGL